MLNSQFDYRLAGGCDGVGSGTVDTVYTASNICISNLNSYCSAIGDPVITHLGCAPDSALMGSGAVCLLASCGDMNTP